MIKINLIATNNYKISHFETSKDATINSIKVILFRDHSDNLPLPTYIELPDDQDRDQQEEDYIIEKELANKQKIRNDNQDIKVKEEDQDVEMKSEKMNVKTSLLPMIIHPHQIRLLFGGKQLDNFATLAECNVQEYQTLLVAISPTFSIGMEQKYNSQKSSDVLYSSHSGGKVSYVLSMDDQATDETASLYSKLDLLNEKEVSDLLVRVPALEPDRQFTSNQEDSKLYKTTKPPKATKPSKPKKGEEVDEAVNNKELDTMLDKMSIKDESVKRPVFRKPKICILTATPSNGVHTYVNQVQFVFSSPFIPLSSNFGECLVPFTITPTIPDAKWRWSDGLTCVYQRQPYSSFPNANAYTIKFDKDIIQKCYGDVIFADGLLDTQYSFETYPSSPVNLVFNQLVGKPQLSVQFSDIIGMTNQEISKILSLSTSVSSTPVKFKILDGPTDPLLGAWFKQRIEESTKGQSNPPPPPKETILYIDIQQSLSTDTRYSLICDAGLKSSQGTILSLKPTTLTFQTPKRFKLVQSDRDYKPTMDSISIQFTNPLSKIDTDDREMIDSLLNIKPRPDVIKRVRSSNTTLIITGEYEPDVKYSIKLFKTITSIYEEELTESETDVLIGGENALIKFNNPQYYNIPFNLNPLASPIINIKTNGIKKLEIVAYELPSLKVTDYLHFNPMSQARGGGVFGFFENLPVDKFTKIPLKEIGKRDVNIDHVIRKETETSIDLSQFFGGDTPRLAKKSLLFFSFTNSAQTTRVCKVYQYSPLTINIKQTTDQVITWVTNVIDNTVVSSPMIETYAKGSVYPTQSVIGGQNGTVNLDREKAFELIVINSTFDKKTNVCVMPFSSQASQKTSKLTWDIMNDLGCYRPGDKVNVKGVLRIVDEDGMETPLEHFGDNTMGTITYTLQDNRKKEFFKNATVKVNVMGSFHISFTLPEDINLGDSLLKLSTNSGAHTHQTTIKVLECKRKDYEVDYDIKYRRRIDQNNSDQTKNRLPSKFIRAGEPFYIQAYGRAFTGEVLANTAIKWSVCVSTRKPAFLPVDDYTFKDYDDSVDGYDPTPSTYVYESKRNPSGRHLLRLLFDRMAGCVSVRVTGEMKDLTNRAETFTHSFEVLDERAHFGVSKVHAIYNINEEMSTKMVVVNSAGEQVDTGKVNVKLIMHPWANELDEEVLPPKTILETSCIPSKDIPIIFNHQFEQRGSYTIELQHVADGATEVSPIHKYPFYIFGVQTAAEKEFKETLPTLSENIASRDKLSKKYPIDLSVKCNVNGGKNDSLYGVTADVGQELDIVVECKLNSGRGYIMCSKKDTNQFVKPFTIEGGVWRMNHTVNVNDFPLISFLVFVEGRMSCVYDGETVERYTSDMKDFSVIVGCKEKTLAVTFDPFMRFQTPNQSSEMTVRVADYRGNKIVGAEVTLIVADESHLQLQNRTVSDWNPNRLYDRTPIYANHSSLTDLTIYSAPTPKAQVVVPHSSTIDFAVRYFSGRILVFEKMPISTTIDHVRKVIQDRDGLPPSSQRLFYLNKQIESGTLESNRIANQSMMNLVIRLSGGGGEGDEKVISDNLPAVKQIKVRDNFCPLATFQTNVFTDVYGVAKFNFTLPDNITKYRLMAFALTQDSFGSKEDFFTSTLPVMIRQSPPRFLNYLDECTFPVIVQNIVDYDVSVQVAFQSTNCKIVNLGFKSTIPANSRIVVPCQIKSMVPNTDSSFHAVIASKVDAMGVESEFCDAVKFTFPVYSPTSLDSSVISNVLTKATEVGQHNVQVPNWETLDQESGGLQIDLSSTKLTKIKSAIKYLFNYEYACSEQISCKLMSLAIAKNLPQLFTNDSEISTYMSKYETATNEMFELLEKRLTTLGEFKYWEGIKSYDYVNMFVYWVLNVLKEEMNIQVPVKLLSKFKLYVGSFVNSFDKTKYKELGLSYLQCLSFGLYLYNKYAKAEYRPSAHGALAESVIEHTQKDHKDSFWNVFVYLIPLMPRSKHVKEIENHIKITGSMAYLESCAVDRFYSSTRTTAMLISTMLDLNPNYHLLPKLITGLESMRRHGGWYNTQDNVYSMYAIYTYCKRTNVLDSSFTTQLFINDSTTEPNPITVNNNSSYSRFIPMKTIIRNQGQLSIKKKGKGPMFYTVSLNYAQSSPLYKPIGDRGIEITREYIALGYEDDVKVVGDELHIKGGSKIKVKLTFDAKQLSSFLILNDRLPAGLEPLNNQPYKPYWCDHINVRDKGVEVFMDTLYPGKYVVTYMVAALCPGKYIAPPAKIEEMYCPSTFGRTESKYIIVL